MSTSAVDDDKSHLLTQSPPTQQPSERRPPVSQDDFRYLLHLIKTYEQQNPFTRGPGYKKRMFTEIHDIFNAYLSTSGKAALSVTAIKNLIANRKRSYAAAKKVMKATGVSFNIDTMKLNASEDDYKRAAETPELSSEDIQLAKKAHIYYPLYEELEMLDGTYERQYTRSHVNNNLAQDNSYGENAGPSSQHQQLPPPPPQVNPELAALDPAYSRRLASPDEYSSQDENDAQEYQDNQQHMHPHQHQLHDHIEPNHHHNHNHHQQLDLSESQRSPHPRQLQRRPPVSQNDFTNLLIMIRDYQHEHPYSNAPGYKKRMFHHIHESFNALLTSNNKPNLSVAAIKNLIANRKRSYTAAKKVMSVTGCGFNESIMKLDATESEFQRALEAPELSSEDIQLAKQTLNYFPFYDQIERADNSNQRQGANDNGQETAIQTDQNGIFMDGQPSQQQSNQFDPNNGIYNDQNNSPSNYLPQPRQQRLPSIPNTTSIPLLKGRHLQRRPPVSPDDFIQLLSLVRDYEVTHPNLNVSGYKKRMFDVIQEQFNIYLADNSKPPLSVSAIRNLIANRKRSYTAAKKVMKALNVKFNLSTQRLDATEADFKRAEENPELSTEDIQMARSSLIYFPLYDAIDTSAEIEILPRRRPGVQNDAEPEDDPEIDEHQL